MARVSLNEEEKEVKMKKDEAARNLELLKVALSLNIPSLEGLLKREKEAGRVFNFEKMKSARGHGFLFTFLRRFTDADYINDENLIEKIQRVLEIFFENGLVINEETDTAIKNPKRDLGNCLATRAAKGFEAQDFSIMNLLIEKGANVNYVDNYGNSPLFFANKIEVCKLLLNKMEKSLIFQKNKNEESAIFYHVKSLSSFRFLYEYGFNQNENLINKNGDNLLMHTVRYGSPEVLLYLIEEQKRKGLLNLQYKNTLTGQSLLFVANLKKKFEILLKNGMNINELNEQGQNVLFVQNSKESVVKTFIRWKIDINHQDNDGNTVLHLLENARVNLVSILNNEGFDFSLKNNQGDTVLNVFEKDDVNHLNNKPNEEVFNLLKKIYKSKKNRK